MNETPEAEPHTSAGPTPGEILRKAREARNLSLGAIATQMNLDLRTVEALEQDDHPRLPAPIFVRGYLRGFARLVGVPEDEVLNAYKASAPPEPTPRAATLPPPRRSTLRLPGIPWRALFTLLVLIALAGAVFEFGPRLVARFMGSEPSSAPASLSLPTPDGADSVPLESSLEAEPVDGGAGVPLALPAAEPSAERSMPLVIDAEEPELAPEVDVVAPPAAQTAPAPEVSMPETPQPEVQAPQPQPAAEAAPAAALQLELVFKDDSWVEIVGGDRRRLLHGLMRAGTTRTVGGQPPISVLLGNAAAVELSVNGKAFDHGRFLRGKVARFELSGT